MSFVYIKKVFQHLAISDKKANSFGDFKKSTRVEIAIKVFVF